MSMQGVPQNVRRRREEGVPGIFSTQLTCFLLGSAVGALAALMFAPKSGRELRADIADATRKGVDGAREKANDYYETSRERATEFYSTAKAQVGEAAGAARQQVTRRGETLSAAIDAGKRAYSEEKRRTQSSALMEPAPTYYEKEPDQS
jgi:gas vesicle protein